MSYVQSIPPHDIKRIWPSTTTSRSSDSSLAVRSTTQIDPDRAAALRCEAGLRGPAREPRARRLSRGRNGKEIDLALLLDGLEAEREQGITIDVAYRYFATSKRKFIVADTPGHEEYNAQHGDRRFDGGSRHHSHRPAGRAFSSRPGATPISPRCSASVMSCSPSTRSISSIFNNRCTRKSSPTTCFRQRARFCQHPADPDSARDRRQRHLGFGQYALVQRARCSNTRKRWNSSQWTRQSFPLPGSNGHAANAIFALCGQISCGRISVGDPVVVAKTGQHIGQGI